MEIFRIKKDIPFMRHALVFNVISLVTFLLAVFFLFNRGLHLSVEFTGGTLIEVSYAQAADLNKIRDGLGKAGQNLWIATRESGEAAIGAPGSGGRATIVAGSLEQSNVDISEQFVDLIAHQRAFQANSKTITTADQMLQELMTIKQ